MEKFVYAFAARRIMTPTSSQKLVLLHLAISADKNGKCWGSIESIAKFCSLSPRAVTRATAYLKREGILRWERGNSFTKQSNTYYLQRGAMEALLGVTMTHTTGHHDPHYGSPCPVDMVTMTHQESHEVSIQVSPEVSNIVTGGMSVSEQETPRLSPTAEDVTTIPGPASRNAPHGVARPKLWWEESRDAQREQYARGGETHV